MSGWQKLLKFAVGTNTPISFSYSSNRSPSFPDKEAPEHPRIVQPLVYGYKMLKNGKQGAFVRAYLLSDYSYSLNTYMNNKTTQNNRDAKYYRLYNIAKMRNVRLASDFDLKKRWYPQKHRSTYNPQDTFFDTIIDSMPSDYSFTYSTVVREDSQDSYIITRLKEELKKHRINYKLPVIFYRTSQNEEVGFIDGKHTYINLVWARQIHPKLWLKGLRSLR